MFKLVKRFPSFLNKSIIHCDSFLSNDLLKKCDLLNGRVRNEIRLYIGSPGLTSKTASKSNVNIAKQKAEGDIVTSQIFRREDFKVPDLSTPNEIFNGIPYNRLPIVHIRSSRNNTIFSLTDYKGKVKAIRSCGIDGFKNTKKGTNVAAQATSVRFCHEIIEKGYRTVRLCIAGLGPGRMSSVRGLVLSGIDIVSVTDTTPFTDNPPRAKKVRRI